MERIKSLLNPLRKMSPGQSPAGNVELVNAARMILDFQTDAAIAIDLDGAIAYMNHKGEQLSGFRLSEAQGQNLEQIIRLANLERMELFTGLTQKVILGARTLKIPSDTILISRAGKKLSVEGSMAPVFGADGKLQGVVLVLHDVSKAKELSAQLAHQANHDALTGLINRREFERRAEQALAYAKNNGAQHALCFMDLDQFKVVNDTCGHAAGDELLRQVSSLLQTRMRSRDTLARLGGDEFGLLLENCPLDEAERIAQEILFTVRSFRFDWEGQTFKIGVSIGITAITQLSEDITKVLSNTDSACYAAKEKGRNRVQIFQMDDKELGNRREEMSQVTRISSAIDENRLTLYFQPIMSLGGEPANGDHCEILVRMLTRDNQIVMPDSFIPAAERYGLMPSLDRWVIENAFSMYQRLYPGADPQRKNTWAINISGDSLGSPGLIEFIREQAIKYKVPPQDICFEITESAAIASVSKAIDFIWGLKMDGFRFALDDFGKGMSSFAYLKNLPVNYLKIDGEFIKDLVSDKINYGLVEAMNRVGQVMGLETIAEWVESAEVMNKLRDMGVNHVQGYVIGKPSSLADREKAVSPNVYQLNNFRAA